jgi:hypothetical protein
MARARERSRANRSSLSFCEDEKVSVREEACRMMGSGCPERLYFI